MRAERTIWGKRFFLGAIVAVAGAVGLLAASSPPARDGSTAKTGVSYEAASRHITADPHTVDLDRVYKSGGAQPVKFVKAPSRAPQRTAAQPRR
jgi:hypothetical protein